MIDNLVLRDPPQPPAKRIPQSFAAKLADVLHDRFEDFLKDVRDIGILQSAPAAPMENERTIEPHEALPRIRFIGSHAANQAARGPG